MTFVFGGGFLIQSENPSSAPFPDFVFVNANNTVYATFNGNNIYTWNEYATGTSWNLLYSSSVIGSVFAASNGDVFAGTISPSGQSEIQRWTANGMNTIIHNTTVQLCYGLFVDDIDRLYCSLGDASFVMMLDLNDSTNTPSFVAGQASPGNTSDRLNIPAGIFVTFDYELYVADSGNNRIQLFLQGQLNATTVAGAGAPGTVTLAGPWAVALDAHEFMFIVDRLNHRIIREGPNGFRCVAGCSSVNGSAHDQLSMPSSLSFDSYGNIFVADTGNRRIQKLELSTKFCGECDRDYCQANESLIPSIHTYISNLQLLCPSRFISQSTGVITVRHVGRKCHNVRRVGDAR